MKVILGIDVGTSGCKVLAIDEKCNVLASKIEDYPLYMPQSGWTEQVPEDWWQASVNGLKAVMEKLGDCEVSAIGLSGQMHGMVALDSDNNVVRPAILWNDQRTAKQCEEIIAKAGGISGLASYTNNNMLTGFTAGKILWMRENEPENFVKTVKIINPKDYILFRLTGKISTDVSDASGTGLFDVRNKCFSSELLGILGIDKNLFADVYESCEIAGYVTDEISAITSVPSGTPVMAGGGDAVLSTIAMGVGSDFVGVMLGTSGVVSLHADDFASNSDGAIQFSRACIGGKFHKMGVTLAAAGSNKWFAENFGNGDFKNCDKLAEESPIGSDGIVFLPYISGERCPVNDPDARGCFVGISQNCIFGDFSRAVLEGVAFSLKQVYDKLGTKTERLILAGGGSKSKVWRQIFADVFGMEVITLTGAGEGSGFGAAIVAGVGIGMFSSVDDAQKNLAVKTVDEPIHENVEKYKKYYYRYCNLYQRLKGF